MSLLADFSCKNVLLYLAAADGATGMGCIRSAVARKLLRSGKQYRLCAVCSVRRVLAQPMAGASFTIGTIIVVRVLALVFHGSLLCDTAAPCCISMLHSLYLFVIWHAVAF